MKIPADSHNSEATTPNISTSPWAGRLKTARPQFWTHADGTPITSMPADLFSTPTSPKLVSRGWNDLHAAALLSHLDRAAFHGSIDRDFSKAWRKDPKTDQNIPRFYAVGTKSLERCQYAVLTHPQRAAVLVIDIDTPSHVRGGYVENLANDVLDSLNTLHARGLGPAWVGVNPINGKAQALWLIDPVYAAAGTTSPNTRLLTAATAELNSLLGGDKAFAHAFSRWPLHKSNDPTAYRWHCQHNAVIRLSDLVAEVRSMTSETPLERPQKAEQYKTGRERIQAAQDARKAAQALRELDESLPSVADVSPAASGVIDGVRVLWSTETRAARDETAFRHALAVAHRLKAQGQALKDAKIIDAYEHGYTVAQAVGADDREPDMPPMRDRLTMARRVRGYVSKGVTNPGRTTLGTHRQSTAGRKALATLGRRGGKKAAERWQDPTSEYAKAERAKLANANQQRSYSTDENKARIQLIVSSYRRQGLDIPSTKEMAAELGLTVRRVQQLRKELGITGKPGRPKKAQ